uniref:Serpin domain-containing protein n=1 Tax=Anopheles farauti TaxID=69004 RepID=A0A182QID8_9DIPT
MASGALAPSKIPLGSVVLLALAGLLSSSVLWSIANAQKHTGPSLPTKEISEQLVGAINDLARTLGRQLGASAGGNSSKAEIFSPVSVGSMMFLLLRLAYGQTRSELLNVLELQQFKHSAQFSSTIPQNLGRLMKELRHDIQGKGILAQLPRWHSMSNCHPTLDPADYGEEEDNDDQYLDEPIEPNVMKLANALFLQEGLASREKFNEKAQNLYQARIVQVNFARQPQAALATINDWVNSTTHGRIERILTQELDPSTQMVVANTLYFKATWETFFNEPQYTRPQPFFPDGENAPSVMVPTMFAGGCYPYHSSPELDARIMAFPYRNRTTSMYIILPNNSTRAKVRQLQASLGSAELDRLIEQMRMQKAIVQMPRLHITNSYDLKAMLQKIGLHKLFDNASSSLKISNSEKRKQSKLFIDQMKHKIFLDVNERGTEGGAVTITAMERSLPPVTFRVRGPFLLAIRHDPTKMLLFYGAVFDPS